MILFGRKDKVLLTKEIPLEVCKDCGKKGGVVSVFQIYYHIAGIPFVPLARRMASQCYSCRNVNVQKNFSGNQKEVAILLKKESKTPLWTMIGAGLIFFYILIRFLIRGI